MCGKPAPVTWSLPRQQAPVDSRGSKPPSAPAAEEPPVRSAPAGGAWTDPAAQTWFRPLPHPSAPPPVPTWPGADLVVVQVDVISTGDGRVLSLLSTVAALLLLRLPLFWGHNGNRVTSWTWPGGGASPTQHRRRSGGGGEMDCTFGSEAALHESISRWNQRNQSSQTLLGGGGGGQSDGAFYFPAATASRGPRSASLIQ